MDSTLIFFSICIINPCLQNIGMGFQKWSVDQTPQAVDSMKKAGWIGIWIIGLLFQAVVVVFGFKALSIGNASTFGAFAGLGLIALALFSWLVLKERIVKKELYGIALLIASTSVLGYFSHGSQSPDVHLDMSRITMFFSVYLVFVAIGIVLLKKKLHSLGGAILGVIGGSMNGIGIVSQKIVTNKAVSLSIDFSSFATFWSTILVLLSDVWTYMMVVGGIGGLIVLQFGYKYGKSVQVVPAHAAMIVIVPAMAGVVLLGETVSMLSWFCIAVITVGVLITTTADPAKHVA